MFGIDISHWQGDNVLSVKYDFIILKLTEGLNYMDKLTPDRLKTLKYRCPIGLYHFMTYSDATLQAKWFYKTLKNVGALGKVMPILDFEATALKLGVDGVEKFTAEFYKLSGIMPVVYCSYGVLLENPILWSYPIWMARYPNSKDTGYYDVPRYKGEIIRQFTSNGKLDGYSGHLDLDIAYIDSAKWQSYCEPREKVSLTNPNFKPKKTVTEIAIECVNGKWGTGSERKKRLRGAGYSYTKIQSTINLAHDIALKVIKGKYGNGEERKAKVTKLGFSYDLVQAWVNVLSKGKK